MKVGEDAIYNTPVIILIFNVEEKHYKLPIWIGPFEGQCILDVLQRKENERPLPYDLINELLSNLDCEVDKIIISDIINNTFYATLILTTNTSKLEIDLRPSDAINIAIRTKKTMYISDKVFEFTKDNSITELLDDNIKYNINKIDNISNIPLDKINPEDFK